MLDLQLYSFQLFSYECKFLNENSNFSNMEINFRMCRIEQDCGLLQYSIHITCDNTEIGCVDLFLCTQGSTQILYSRSKTSDVCKLVFKINYDNLFRVCCSTSVSTGLSGLSQLYKCVCRSEYYRSVIDSTLYSILLKAGLYKVYFVTLITQDFMGTCFYLTTT